jgi:hypothetical protein
MFLFAFDEKEQHKGPLGLFRLFEDVKNWISIFSDLHNVLRSKVVRTLFALSGKNCLYRQGTKVKALTRAENKIF